MLEVMRLPRLVERKLFANRGILNILFLRAVRSNLAGMDIFKFSCILKMRFTETSRAHLKFLDGKTELVLNCDV